MANLGENYTVMVTEEEEEEDQSCDGKTVSNEILKGQVRMAKSGRPPQKTEGNGEH